MKRMTSARLFDEHHNNTQSERFNEVDQESIKSKKNVLSQTRLNQLKNSASQGGNLSQVSRRSRLTIQSAHQRQTAS